MQHKHWYYNALRDWTVHDHSVCLVSSRYADWPGNLMTLPSQSRSCRWTPHVTPGLTCGLCQVSPELTSIPRPGNLWQTITSRIYEQSLTRPFFHLDGWYLPLELFHIPVEINFENYGWVISGFLFYTLDRPEVTTRKLLEKARVQQKDKVDNDFPG